MDTLWKRERSSNQSIFGGNLRRESAHGLRGWNDIIEFFVHYAIAFLRSKVFATVRDDLLPRSTFRGSRIDPSLRPRYGIFPRRIIIHSWTWGSEKMESRKFLISRPEYKNPGRWPFGQFFSPLISSRIFKKQKRIYPPLSSLDFYYFVSRIRKKQGIVLRIINVFKLGNFSWKVRCHSVGGFDLCIKNRKTTLAYFAFINSRQAPTS